MGSAAAPVRDVPTPVAAAPASMMPRPSSARRCRSPLPATGSSVWVCFSARERLDELMMASLLGGVPWQDVCRGEFCVNAVGVVQSEDTQRPLLHSHVLGEIVVRTAFAL